MLTILVPLACLYCRRSHMTCDSNRPCARCVKRNIGHLCHDEVKDKHRENGTESTGQSPAVESTTSPDQNIDPDLKTGIRKQMKNLLSDDIQIDPQAATSTSVPSKTRLNISPPPMQPSTSDTFDFLNLSWQSYPYLQAPYTFASDVIGNEFSVLNDFMTLGDDLHEPSFESTLGDNIGGMMTAPNFNVPGSTSQFNAGQPNNPNGSVLGAPGQPGPDSLLFDPTGTQTMKAPSPNPNGREAEVAKEHYLLTAADPVGDVPPEERLKQVIKAKVEAGILKPFNYVKGYARLQRYMELQYLFFYKSPYMLTTFL